MKILFVTGSGTGVGKTYVTAALVQALRDKGRVVRALKPIVTGYPGDGTEPTDTEVLLRAQGLDPDDANAVAACSPWRFEAPLSPNMAAEREDRDIDFDALVSFCLEPGDEDVRLIEGIGGAMVPLTDTHTVLDWIAAVGAPALLVTGSYLGTLSHTLTAVTALKGRSVTVAGVVVSESEEDPVSWGETVATLKMHVGGIPVAGFGRDRDVAVFETVSAMAGF